MELEKFYYDNKIVKLFLNATVFWGIIGMVVGLLIALQIPFPALNFDLEYTTFGRTRPIHTNAIIFAFVGNAIFMGAYHSMQRLLKTRMFSDALSKFHFWGWQLIIVAAAITLSLGYTQSKEYAELEWPIDIAIAIVWVAFGINIIGTILKRRVKHIYVAIWFFLASWAAVALLHIFNSIEIPVSFLKSYPVYAGVQDALVQWWYGHNAVAFFLTTPYLGLMYYYLPKISNRPIYSYHLSILHFWSLIFLYMWAGPHHLLYNSLPDWAQTLGVLFSVMLIAPSWGGMINGLLTFRGVWDKVRQDPTLKFMVVAITAYGMATFEGPMLSLKSVNAISHFTDWTVAHTHIGAMGWNGFLTFAVLYYLVPKLWGTKLYSQKLSNVHFWLGTLGILVYAIPMYWTGITQSLMWKEFTDEGMLRYPNFLETTVQTIPMHITRAIGGAIYLAGAVIMVINLVKTAKSGSFIDNEETQAAPMPVVSRARLAGETLHGWLERKPIQFLIWTTVAVAIGGAVEIIPMITVKANIPTIESVKPYTPLELEGRDIYISEGCYNCHSQMVRPFRSEVERYGDYSKAGEFVYDHPFQWGSKRTGPDLARTGVPGGKMYKSAAWHYKHMEKPTDLSPGSIMPAYPWLLKKDVDLDDLAPKIRVMQKLGVPYEEGYDQKAKVDYMAQASEYVTQLKDQGIETSETKEIIALIAYMHRLGRDITVEKKKNQEEAQKKEKLDFTVLTSNEALAKGQEIYAKQCAACHGAVGEGNPIGPSLIDDVWVFGNSNDDIYRAVYEGNPDKGMPAWKYQLDKPSLQQVSSYIINLKNQKAE